MNEPFSIVPPPELRRQWLDNDHFPMVTGTHELLSITRDRLNSVIDQAAQWGADQELEACCIELTEKIITNSLYEGDKTHASWRELASIVVRKLRAARRPKPPSDKELALNALSLIMSQQKGMFDGKPFNTIRRALEALPND